MITMYLVDQTNRCWVTGWPENKKQAESLKKRWKHDFPDRIIYEIEGRHPPMVNRALEIKDGKLVLDKDGHPKAAPIVTPEHEIAIAKERFLLSAIKNSVSMEARSVIEKRMKILARNDSKTS